MTPCPSPTAGMQINSLMAAQLLGEKDESIKLSSFVAAFDSQAHRCSRGSTRICQFLTAGFRSCVSGAQGCCCCSWRCLDRHWHQGQEKLRKTHRLQWPGAVFRGGLPPVGRPFQWRQWRPEPSSWRSPATSEALQLGVRESFLLLWNSIHCVAEAAGCQLDQFERSRLLWVPRFANLVAMFGQFVRCRVFFWMLRAIVTAVSLTTFGNIERPKMWNRQLQMVGLATVTFKRSGNRLPSFYPHSPLLGTPGALPMSQVPMGRQTCWKSWGTLVEWRSWILKVALKFHPLRGRSCGVPAGPIWEKQTSLGASFCKLGCDVWPVR